MTDDEYVAAIREIEREANAEFAAARARFRLMYPARRSARYANGMGDAIIARAIEPVRDAIEADMKARTEAVEREYYAQESADSR